MESALHVAADHPAYTGHFPGHPILPGVVLVAEALAAIAQTSGRAVDAWTLAGVKFLYPVTPGTALTLVQSAGDGGSVRFEVRAGDRVVASGNVVPRR
jgi:3-hydroxymyristoyl/3-hydroxydecanoyl-(acyl carrier protein) dehydratase